MSSPLSTPVLPYGLRRVVVTPYTDQTCVTLGSAIRLPVAQTLSFKESEDFKDLQGDDETVATHGAGPTVSWELDAGGISLEAWSVITGGSLSSSGSGGSAVKVLTKNINTQRPYFKIEGQAISDSGGDLHCEIWRAKMDDDMEGEFGYGEFLVTKCQGVGYGSLLADGARTPVVALGELYRFTQNATVTNIPDIAAPASFAHGTVTSTTIPVTWATLAGATAYHLYWKLSSGGSWTQSGGDLTGTSSTVSGLTTATTYDLKLCGVDANGEGAFSYLTGVTTS